MYFSSLQMADEWDDDYISVGKSFGRGTFAGQTPSTVDSSYPSNDSGFNPVDGSENENDYSNNRGGDRRGRGRGRGGGFGSSRYNNERNNDSEQNDNENGERRGGRGRGRGGRGRGGYDEYGEDKFNAEKPKEFYIPPEPSNDENEIFGGGISSGINFTKYDKIPINVTGDTVPVAIQNFECSGLRSFLLENVKKSGYEVPTPIQKNAIPIIMAKRDLMASAQTGSGKTAAFLLPIINILLEEKNDNSIGKPHVVIISPTRELAIQIFNEARKFANKSYLKTCILYGGTATRHQGDNVAKGCHILVATPGRLLDFVEKCFVSFEDVRFVVLDEADRMLDMGFMPDIERMMNHITMPSSETRQTLMFSATFPDEIQKLAGKFLNNYIFLAIGKVGGACSDVKQVFFEVTKYEKKKKLMEILEENENSTGIMVFVETKRNADFLAAYLCESKFPTTSIHGDRMQRQREEALRDFKSGRMKILIATSVAARGLDIKNVQHVINYDLPKSVDEYVHRIGRTGRVGNCGLATSFYDFEQDSAVGSSLVDILKESNQEVPSFLSNSGGGYGNYSQSKFGGKDVRNSYGNREESLPAPQEPEEDWN